MIQIPDMRIQPFPFSARSKHSGLLLMQQLLAGALVVLASGCVFFEVPRDQATQLLLTPVHSRSPATTKDVPAQFAGPRETGWRNVQLDLRAWSTKLPLCRDRTPETSPPECWTRGNEPPAVPQGDEEMSVEFLLISDAQTRDERAYEPGQLRWIDLFIEPTIRLPLVEVMDGIVLQTFVSAYSQHVNEDQGDATSRLLINGGDLLDVSLVTELVEANETLSRAEPEISVFSVVGNHDGLTWGNLPDSRTTTWELGINRTEFILGGILYSPDETGFGFACNEIISGLRRGESELRSALPETSEALDRIDRYKESFQARDEAELLPIAVKGIVSVSRVEDASNQLGYYAFERNGLRFIVLDTAAKDSVAAEVDPVQLGWLYLQLRDAWIDGKGVILVSHHGPKDFAWHSESTLKRALELFPNIIAHFHGHGHEPRVEMVGKVPVIETPSIIDYPEAGSLVRIFRRKDDSSLRITVSLVRPIVSNDSADAILLDSLLEETWINSYYDNHSKFRSRYGPYRAVSWLRDDARSFSMHRSPVRDLNGSLQFVWQAQHNEQVPSAADFFGSKRAADQSCQMRKALGLAVWCTDESSLESCT